LIVLAQKAYEQPALLEPKDLDPTRDIVGDGAFDYALVVASFHYVNRIADLLGIVTEFLPIALQRFEFVRRMAVKLLSFFIGMMDLSNRKYHISYDEAIDSITPLFQDSLGKPPGGEFRSIMPRPKLIEVIGLAMEERDRYSSLDPEIITKIHKTVEKALPKSKDDMDGFHARPDDPIEQFAFVGTRYAYRVTNEMIDLLRGEGFDDLGLLDLAIAIADANQWARFYRILDLPPELFYL